MVLTYMAVVCLLVPIASLLRPPPLQITADAITAILSESLRSNRITACEGETVKLHCPRNTHIVVETTFYGRLVPTAELCPQFDEEPSANSGAAAVFDDLSCDVSNAHAKVVELCKNKRKCRILVKSSFFDLDPCPATAKYIQISYKCKPISFDDQSFCDGSTMQLSCRANKRLAIYSANYGRTVNGQSMCTPNTPVTTDCTIDVLAKLLPECHAQTECSLTISDQHFGAVDCPAGTNKYLTLIFMCVNDKVFSEAAIERRLESINALHELLASSQTTTSTRTTTVSVSRSTIVASNDAAYMPIPPPSFTDERPTPSLDHEDDDDEMIIRDEPLPLPNAIGLMHEMVAMFNYLKDNKEKAILYFSLSASSGVILLLIGCIIQQLCQRRTMDQLSPNRYATVNGGGGVDASKVDYDDTYARSPLFMERTDTGARHMANGFDMIDDLDTSANASYMRFNQLTPPRRLPAVQHYYS